MFANRLHQVTCATFILCASQFCWAQSAPGIAEPGDPVRWYQQDSTPHDYYLTLKKEAEAAYQEAKVSCQAGDRVSRSACLKDAQAQFKQDMRDAKDKEQQQAQ